MRSYELREAGLDPEGVPVFKFTVEMRVGEDLDGTFKIQFAAVEREGEARFAINSPSGLLGIFSEEDSVEVATALADHEEYILLADYENRAWSDMDGLTVPLMGRELGKDVDYRERYELTGEDRRAVHEISEVLRQRLE